jgi:protease I
LSLVSEDGVMRKGDEVSKELEGLRVAALVEEGFEEVELTEPMRALQDVGARVDIVSPREDRVRSWHHGNWGHDFQVDTPLVSVDAAEYDALLLPGGVRNPVRMRRNPDAWRFIRAFFDAIKPVAAICHAPWLLIDSGTLDGRKVTSFPSLQEDLRNAGGHWVDQEVVVDRGLITSRNPDDIPVFSKTFITEIARSRQDSVRGR